MDASKRDPLLVAAKLIVGVGIGIMILVMAMIALGLGVAATAQRADVIAAFTDAGAPKNIIWLVAVAIGLGFALLLLGMRFLLELFGIIDSVGKADPFQPENGARLSRMAWLALGAQGVALALKGAMKPLEPYLIRAGHRISVEFDISLEGVLLVLVLLILARVFRQGTAMRDDLAGTV